MPWSIPKQKSAPKRIVTKRTHSTAVREISSAYGFTTHTKPDNLRFIEGEDEAQIAWLLNTEEDSPFTGLISRGTVERNQLFALHSVAKEIKRLFSVGPVADLDVQTKAEFAGQFFEALRMN
jgi:hypothetical protein